MRINALKLTGLNREIFDKRYAMPGETEWIDCAERVAKNISNVELADLAGS
jgi:hypothetical protein